MPEIDSDKAQIDQLVRDFFSAFTNKGRKPDLEVLSKVCTNEATIVKNTRGIYEHYDLESFIRPRKALLSNGTLQDFEEYEVDEQTTITRNIAQRLSYYQKEGILNQEPFSEKGCKMFQLIKHNDTWKINSVIWDDE